MLASGEMGSGTGRVIQSPSSEGSSGLAFVFPREGETRCSTASYRSAVGDDLLFYNPDPTGELSREDESPRVWGDNPKISNEWSSAVPTVVDVDDCEVSIYLLETTLHTIG